MRPLGGHVRYRDSEREQKWNNEETMSERERELNRTNGVYQFVVLTPLLGISNRSNSDVILWNNRMVEEIYWA